MVVWWYYHRWSSICPMNVFYNSHILRVKGQNLQFCLLTTEAKLSLFWPHWPLLISLGILCHFSSQWSHKILFSSKFESNFQFLKSLGLKKIMHRGQKLLLNLNLLSSKNRLVVIQHPKGCTCLGKHWSNDYFKLVHD